MTVLQAVLLGLIQGITEFLPVSSSGHLSIFQNFFGVTGEMRFDALLHLGTLLGIYTAYQRDIREMLLDCTAFFRRGSHMALDGTPRFRSARLLVLILTAALPLLLVLPIRRYIGQLFNSTVFVGLALILTGTMLYVSDRMARRRKSAGTMRMTDALLVGLCQAVATVPGLSSSGTAITAGMACGLERAFAVKFAFLISIPAVLGANLLALFDVIGADADWSLLPACLLGTLTAAVAGYFSSFLLRYLVHRGRFGGFACYCAFAGCATLVLSFVL